MYKLLLIDNEVDYCKAIKNAASLEDIHIEFYHNFQKGIEVLEERVEEFQGVIFDARCFKDNIQESNKEETDNAIYGSINQFQALLRKKNAYLPHCVNTGFSSTFKESIEGMGVLVFEKNNESRDQMFQFFKEQIDNLPDIKIEKKHKEVFEVFNKNYLDITLKKHLITALREIESGHIDKKLFNPLRWILEAIYKKANKTDKKWLPDDIIKPDGRPNMEWSHRYMTGLKTDTNANNYPANYFVSFPPHISRIVHNIKEVTSIISHTYNENVTRYALMNVTFGIMEVLIWFKNYIDNNYSD